MPLGSTYNRNRLATVDVTAELTTDVSRAAHLIREGGMVAFATETVYGLGANALDPRAVARVFDAKQRPHFDPLIVHVADESGLETLVTEVPALARPLMKRFWPGPLTLVLPKREIVPDLVTSGLPSVAVRIPDHPQARELIRLSGVPIAAPSANLFGRISPTTAAHVLEQLGDRIDAVLDGGPCRVGVESTVLDLSTSASTATSLTGSACEGDRETSRPRLLRPGGVTLEEIESVIGSVTCGIPVLEQQGPQPAPGMLAKHYAPAKPVRLVDDWESVREIADVGILTFRDAPHLTGCRRVEVLSPTGSLAEAAANFFAALRRLDDDAAVGVILAQRFPNEGLGRALNDRLQRASAR